MSKTKAKGFASHNGNPSQKLSSKLQMFQDEVFAPLSQKYEETFPDKFFVELSDGSKARDIQQMLYYTPEFFEPQWYLCEPPEDKNDQHFEDIKEVVGFKHESERYGKIYFPDTRYTDRCPSLCWEIISNGIGGQVPVLTYYGFHRILEREAV